MSTGLQISETRRHLLLGIYLVFYFLYFFFGSWIFGSWFFVYI